MKNPQGLNDKSQKGLNIYYQWKIKVQKTKDKRKRKNGIYIFFTKFKRLVPKFYILDIKNTNKKKK